MSCDASGPDGREDLDAELAPGVQTTLHARRRLKERAKLPIRAAQRAAKLALERGLTEDDPRLSPPLRAKIGRSRARHQALNGTSGVYRVYNGCLYIFSAELVFITVLVGFDDPDQKGASWGKDGVRWKRGERKRFKQGQRPRTESED